ncbi:MAG: Gfo/Idh/MocA family oxidoreductase [Myxococcota bacterium]
MALLGCGAMGQRHAATVDRDPEARLAVVVDIVEDRADALAHRFGAAVRTDVPAGIDAAIVATPTSTHVDVARPLLERGIPCLVEKPLASTVRAARDLDVERCFVGHIERFNPALVQAGALSPQVVVGRRVAPPTGRSSDVDVVLDLMIHDLDLLLHWGGAERWHVVDAKGVGVPGRVDTASVQLRSAGGRTASLLASRVASHRERVLHCYEPGRTTRLDLVAGTCVQTPEAPTGERTSAPRHEPSRDALLAQWSAFRAAVAGDGVEATSSRAGLRAVQLAEDIREAVVT